MVDTIKFSEMTAGGDLANGEKTPGLLGGSNVLFNNPWTFLPPGTTAERPIPSSLINFRLRFNTSDQLYEYYDAVLMVWTQLQETAFTVGPYVTYKADASLPDAFNLGLLTSGILKQTVSLGVSTPVIALNGTDYYGPGFSGYFQNPAGINDINGNAVVNYLSIVNAVNSIDFQNAATNSPPIISASGSDANIGLLLSTKNIAAMGFRANVAGVNHSFTFYSGTSGQHQANFTFADTGNNIEITWQDVNGTVAYLADIISGSVNSLTGTANQVLVNGTVGTPTTGVITLTTPQNIGTTSAPTFASLTLSSPLTVGNGGTGITTIPTNGQIPIGNGTNYTAATLTAGTGISITNGSGSISLAANGVNQFVDQTTNSVTMAVNTVYLCDAGASLITFTLPPSSVIGSWLMILGNSSGGWTIAQTAGQVIKVSPATTTIGVVGSLSSVNQFDCVTLRCIAANTGWVVVSQQSVGLTIV